MRLLLTGATGFVGRNFLLEALRGGRYEEIWLPVRSQEKLRAQFEGDGFDAIPRSVKVIVSSAPDWSFSHLPKMDEVVHSAGLIFANRSSEYRRTNVEGTLSLLRTLPQAGKVILLSSMAAGGPCALEEESRSEEQPDGPITWYGQSKLEMEVRVMEEFPHLEYLFLRPPLIFGARDHATLPLFKMVKIPLHFKPGMKTKRYSFISVNDLVRAIFAALDYKQSYLHLPHRRFFVSAPDSVTDKQLLTSAAKAHGMSGLIVPIPQSLVWMASRCLNQVPAWRDSIPSLAIDRVRDLWPDRWVVSPEAFENQFQWRATENLDRSLKETRDWYVRTGQL